MPYPFQETKLDESSPLMYYDFEKYSGSAQLPNSKILIIGGLGYLGSRLAPMLYKQGYHVKIIDTGFFKQCIIGSLPSEFNAIELIEKDARDIAKHDLDGFDVVVHFAGISNDPMGSMDDFSVYNPTREYAKKIALLCKNLGIRFIYASSCSVYGKSDGCSILDENSAVNPQTGYSINKFEVEQDLKSICDENFSPIALRFATVYGPSTRIRFDIVVNMLCGMAYANKKIILNSDGTAWRPNLHIDDLCSSVIHSINSNYNKPDLLILNVGSDESNMQIKEIASLIQSKISNCELAFLKNDPSLDTSGLIKDRKVTDKDTRTYKVDFSKIKEYFPGFHCKYSMSSGIDTLIEFFDSVELSDIQFNSKNFYRLQTLETLLQNSSIDKSLRWIT